MFVHPDFFVEKSCQSIREVACGPSLCIGQRTSVGYKTSIWDGMKERGRQYEEAKRWRERFVNPKEAEEWAEQVAQEQQACQEPEFAELVMTERNECQDQEEAASVPSLEMGPADPKPRRRRRRRRNPERNISDEESGTESFDPEFAEARHPNCDQLPKSTPLYNKVLGGIGDVRKARNIRMQHDAVYNYRPIGKVFRDHHKTVVDGLHGRRMHTKGSRFWLRGAHHFGPPEDLPPWHIDTRLVYIYVRKVRWATVDNVAFQSFAWPMIARSCRSIVRILFTNHCQGADVLIVRGRCFGSQASRFSSNRVLENLLWHWRQTGRPYLVYKEGSSTTGSGDPVPAWLAGSEFVSSNFCQCNLVLQDFKNWHRPGQLYSNVPSTRQLFDPNYEHYRFHGYDCSQTRPADPTPIDDSTPSTFNKLSANQSVCGRLCRSLVWLTDFRPRIPTRCFPREYLNKIRPGDFEEGLGDDSDAGSDGGRIAKVREWQQNLQLFDWANEDDVAKKDDEACRRARRKSKRGKAKQFYSRKRIWCLGSKGLPQEEMLELEPYDETLARARYLQNTAAGSSHA